MSSESPHELFKEWYTAAQACSAIVDPSAMALATANRSGRPSVRMVLLKDFCARGFEFYTHLESPKARDLRENPQAELGFHWAPLKRQIRIHGAVTLVEPEEADRYFATRPRLSQVGAWASEQSRPMAHRYTLEAAVATAAARFGFGAVPRPPHWSGFRLVPDEMEFWTERPFRHHERFLFSRTSEGWERRWLFP